MKRLLLIFSLAWIAATAYSQGSHTSMNDTRPVAMLSAGDWQSDLRFLQHKVHQEYPFLFKKIKAEDFDAEVDRLYNAIPAMQQHEILAGFARIVSSFRYGHTQASWIGSKVKYHVAPVNFHWFSDGIFVEGISREYERLAGARLVKVEGMDLRQALERIKPLVPAENEQYFRAYGLDFLVIPEALHAQGISKSLKTSITYTFEKDGKTFDATVTSRDAFRLPRNYGMIIPDKDWVSARKNEETPNYLKNLDKIYYYEYLPASRTVYVRHSQIQDEAGNAIPEFYKTVFDFIEKNDVEKLVIDVRLNGGGDNFKNKPVITGIIENRKINKPGKLFIIIGKRTFSACQNLVNELSNYTNALFVGEPTAENINFYGDNRRVELPKSGLPVFLSFAWWQDKPQWANDDWQAPQLAAELSFSDYRNGRDPVLQACLDFSENEPVLDPFGKLRDLYKTGKKDEVMNEARKMVADPKYRYVNFESKINQAGYDLLNEKKLEDALFVFDMNTKLYPASANAWDSLAEANWKAGNKGKAVEYYSKAIEMDAEGPIGENARRMLKEINK